jgi:hypothetical protein
MNTPTPSPRPLPPFEWASSNLGFSNRVGIKTKICFFDRLGQMWQTDSVEYILRFIDCFDDKHDRYRLLAAAALHYGFDDAWFLIRGHYFDAAVGELN